MKTRIKKRIPRIIGMLCIKSGIVRIFGAILILSSGLQEQGPSKLIWNGTPAIYLVPAEFQMLMAVVIIIVGIIATFGGICALRKTEWKMVLAGAIASVSLCWYLGIPALLLLVFYRKTFYAQSNILDNTDSFGHSFGEFKQDTSHESINR